MNDASSSRGAATEPRKNGSMLELITAAVLLLVLASLGWMVIAAYWPGQASFTSSELEVITVLGLLAAALVLVSLVALLHTRK